MNRTGFALLAALALIWLAPASATSPSTDEAKAPPARWMLAQGGDRPRPTCESDNRKMPRGSIVCREGKQAYCGPYGNWVETGKAC
jgi:hypothetical protein